MHAHVHVYTYIYTHTYMHICAHTRSHLLTLRFGRTTSYSSSSTSSSICCWLLLLLVVVEVVVEVVRGARAVRVRWILVGGFVFFFSTRLSLFARLCLVVSVFLLFKSVCTFSYTMGKPGVKIVFYLQKPCNIW